MPRWVKDIYYHLCKGYTLLDPADPGHPFENDEMYFWNNGEELTATRASHLWPHERHTKVQKIFDKFDGEIII